jgi:hypothetical protein
MRIETRVLTTIGLTAALLAGTAHRGFAVGPGGVGYGTVGKYNYDIDGVGPLSGPWTLSGAVTGWVSTLTNPTPDSAGRASPTALSSGLIMVNIEKNEGFLRVHFVGGQFQTPTMGLTSNNGAFNSLAPYGSPSNPKGGPEVSYWVTAVPSQYWSVSVGRMGSLEGVESGQNFIDPTFFVSELNNMETAGGYGAQLNLFYGPATINLQYSAATGTIRTNILQGALTYNLNADGSDYIIGFGHTNIGHTGNPGQNQTGVGRGFSEANSSLVGLGAQWISGPWSVLPEAEYQWLPKNSVSAASGDPKPLTTYYNVAAMTDVTYAFNKTWSATGQIQYVFQNGDKHDPNEALFGNWLQFDSLPGQGTFSPGTSMAGAQFNVTWQHQNFYVRPTVAYTHIAGFAPGTGYGLNGLAADQVVGVFEIGFLFGNYPS